MTTVSVVDLNLRLGLFAWVVGILFEENLRLARALKTSTAAANFRFERYWGIDQDFC